MRLPPPRRCIRLWISLLPALLAGCATHKDRVLPQDGPTLRQIYEDHFGRLQTDGLSGLRRRFNARAPGGAPPAARPVGGGTVDLAGYTRDAEREIEAIFPAVPNPTLVMYVFPHLAGAESVPVPGYATTFPMYEKAEYALPGEVALYGER